MTDAPKKILARTPAGGDNPTRARIGKYLSCYVEPHQAEWIEKRALARGVTRALVVRDLIDEAIRRRTKKS